MLEAPVISRNVLRTHGIAKLASNPSTSNASETKSPSQKKTINM